MIELERNLLWTDYRPRPVFGLPLGRRMAAAKAESGQLVIFSPLPASNEAVAALNALGRIAAFVIPSRFHDQLYEDYFDSFAKARFLAGPASIHDHPHWLLAPISPDAPELAGFAFELVGGMPKVQEHVFLHRASKTLIIADALFNLPFPDDWWSRLLMKAADMGGPPRPSRLFRSLIRSRPEFSQSLRKILQWDFDRILPGHGDVIERDGKAVLERAFRAFLS